MSFPQAVHLYSLRLTRPQPLTKAASCFHKD
nr:MAG TPA: hypothetical protein [Caudoviricetes sp.]